MAKKIVKKRISKKGLPPGTHVYTGIHNKNESTIELIKYNRDIIETNNLQYTEIDNKPGNEFNYWYNITGVHQVDLIEELTNMFDIHLLHQEDIMNVFQRPKVEEEGDYIYLVLKMISWDEYKNNLEEEQVSFFLKGNTLLTFQEKSGDHFDPIRERLKDESSRARDRKSDYLFYLLIDIIVDRYFEILDKLSDKIEFLEDNILSITGENHLLEIQDNKRELILMRKVTYPLREALTKLIRNESALIEEKNIRYFRDIYDHVIQILDTIDANREINVSLKDIYLN